MEPSGSEASKAQSKDKGNVPVIDVDSENVNQSVDERVSDHVDEQKKRSKDKKKQTKLSFKPATMGESGGTLVSHSFNQERYRKAVARMCIKDNRPFSIVEDEGFSELVWELNSEFELPSRWTGVTIGNLVYHCLQEWGITRVFTVTVDNASSNDGAIRRLRTLLKGPNAILQCKYMHLRCCAHIINLVVRDGLEEQNASICKIQNAVKYLRLSSGRQENFKKGVEFEKVDCKRKPCLDVDTRWNSTFLLMMPKTKKKRKNVVGVPNEDDWSNARFFIEYLRIFYDVTKKISGSKYVTSNMFVKDLVTIHAAISKMCRHTDENKRKIALSMKDKYDKYWDNLDNMNVLLYVALVLDPRNKLKYLEFCLDLIYPKSRTSTETYNQGDQVLKRLKTLSAKTIKICNIVEDAFNELYLHYKIKLDKHNDQTFTVSSFSTPLRRNILAMKDRPL
ncbi:zinc finger BED domain-containing protein RICESLEEPER 2-like protein [Tanacetum coccineum]